MKGTIIVDECPLIFQVFDYHLRSGKIIFDARASGEDCPEFPMGRYKFTLIGEDGIVVAQTFMDDFGWEHLGKHPGHVILVLPIQMVEFL